MKRLLNVERILLSIIMILGLLSLYGGYKVYKNVFYLLAYEKMDAKIVSCEPKKFKNLGSAGVLSKSSKVQYTPIAKATNGLRVSGALYYDRNKCLKGVGSTLSVLIDPANKEDSYMLTFVQFWLMPLVIFLVPIIICLIFLLPIYKALGHSESNAEC